MVYRDASSNRDRKKRKAKSRSARFWEAVNRQISPKQVAVGIGVAIVIAFLVIGFDFRSFPVYELGEIADRDVVAFREFTVEDKIATDSKKEENLATVPAIFDLDMSISTQIVSELRSSFKKGREILATLRGELELRPAESISLSSSAGLVEAVSAELPNLAGPDSILPILVENGFSLDLEDQMATLLLEAMQSPGVVASRDSLRIFRERGVILLSSGSTQDLILNDPDLVRDITQARALIRQNEFQLTAVERGSNPRLITFLEDRIVPTVRFNASETLARETLALDQVSPVLIQIKRGRTIVRAGDEVGPQQVVILRELEEEISSQQTPAEFLGISLIGLFFIFTIWRYVQNYAEKIDPKPAFFLTVGILLSHLIVARGYVVIANLVSSSLNIEFLKDPGNFYWIIPAAFGSILLVLLVGGQIAILYTLVMSVFLAMMCGNMIFGIYGIVSSLTAVYALRHYRERSAMGRAGLIVGLSNIVALAALQLHTSTFHWKAFLVALPLGFMGGMASVMLASLLLPLLEYLFKITTDIRLLELSNLNNPILKRLALEAPGTYHHSLNVGVLAEAAAEAVGANPLLSRVGAYYHDIGKMEKPEYYVENQIYMPNKHEKLSPRMSSLVLASHVKDGLELAREIGLTPKVAALIPEHHGTKLMTFFYQKAKRALEEKRSGEAKRSEVDEGEFRYPGPKPQSKEAAILMLADQAEAAARTLQDPNPSHIRSLIRRLIQGTIEDRQFDECAITTRDLHLITRTFERIITGMHHHRIEYPGYEFNKKGEKKQPRNQSLQ
jgi:putative nucleotidyltransferase with HDIG domain